MEDAMISSYKEGLQLMTANDDPDSVILVNNSIIPSPKCPKLMLGPSRRFVQALGNSIPQEFCGSRVLERIHEHVLHSFKAKDECRPGPQATVA